jgi:hypothetical protein
LKKNAWTLTTNHPRALEMESDAADETVSQHHHLLGRTTLEKSTRNCGDVVSNILDINASGFSCGSGVVFDLLRSGCGRGVATPAVSEGILVPSA